ncbi:hypothetical protein [Nostoc sp. WHI]|uniref:hypothetical protein n=1 Tax=Nostoc sp. WHI TaxID=2650611 RepID=UPI0018C65E71|nr:hypothetical protein [Nostoc sp. WHI]MBG1269271.1 hypothetical protein [Nostoc sp. WHI]
MVDAPGAIAEFPSFAFFLIKQPQQIRLYLYFMVPTKLVKSTYKLLITNAIAIQNHHKCDRHLCDSVKTQINY